MTEPGGTPVSRDARLAEAQALHRQGRFAEALAALDDAGPSGDGHPAEPFLRGALLMRLGRVDEAIDVQRLGIAREDQPRARLALANMLRAAGDIEGAAREARAALARDPGLGEAWWTLANLKTVPLGDADRSAMKAALAGDARGPYDRACLHFALARAFAETGAADEEWHHLAQANGLRAASLGYRPEALSALVEATIAAFTPAFFSARAGHGEQSAAPVFIVGMPRAGSTLVERMLAAGGQIVPCGELPEITAIAASLGQSGRRVDRSYLAALADLPGERLAEIGRGYIEAARRFVPAGADRFSDKMPNNWLLAGLIGTILPNARIVDVRRHPLDCGLSNFRENFARGQAYSYDLAHIGAYYADYVRTMEHFQKVRPGRVHRVIYDRLVGDPETELRALCAFLGLEWSPAMLEFHTAEGSVRTASAAQVRQALNDRGIGGWRRHDERLAPLKDALGPVIQHWDR